MEHLATVLSDLGDSALTAFIVYQITGTIELLTFFGLVTWGVRAWWKFFKEHQS
jgi:hypothetical protein